MENECKLLEEFQHISPKPVFIGLDHNIQSFVGLLCKFLNSAYGVQKLFDFFISFITFDIL